MVRHHRWRGECSLQAVSLSFFGPSLSLACQLEKRTQKFTIKSSGLQDQDVQLPDWMAGEELSTQGSLLAGVCPSSTGEIPVLADQGENMQAVTVLRA